MSENPTLTPHIVVSDAAAAIDFYKAAFGAVETSRHLAPKSGKVMHASLSINGGVLMLNDDFSGSMGCKSETPEALGGSPVIFHLEVADADAAWAKALSAGAQVKYPLADQFWGARYGQLRDPFGHYWSVSHCLAQPTDAEVEEAAKTAISL
jgi:PhnB protein